MILQYFWTLWDSNSSLSLIQLLSYQYNKRFFLSASVCIHSPESSLVVISGRERHRRLDSLTMIQISFSLQDSRTAPFLYVIPKVSVTRQLVEAPLLCSIDTNFLSRWEPEGEERACPGERQDQLYINLFVLI